MKLYKQNPLYQRVITSSQRRHIQNTNHAPQGNQNQWNITNTKEQVIKNSTTKSGTKVGVPMDSRITYVKDEIFNNNIPTEKTTP